MRKYEISDNREREGETVPARHLKLPAQETVNVEDIKYMQKT